MNTLLVINSSPKTKSSISRKLTAQFAADWKQRDPQNVVIQRDLADGSIPFLNEAWIEDAYTPEPNRTTEQSKLLELSDTLIDEVLSADVIVLGIPMHNFSVPAVFKAWIDQIARAGKTFSYSDKGPKGMVPSDKKVVAVLSRGGAYAPENSPAGIDLQETYLRQILGFIGLTDITFVHADRQSMGEHGAKSAEKAIHQLASIIEGRCVEHAA